MRVFVLEMDPGRVEPRVSVQPAWNRSRGLLRGVCEHGALIEDHIREELDEHGTVRDAGRRIFGDTAIRRQSWTVAEHLAGWPAPVAVTGNGNLLSNPHFVAVSGGMKYHLRGEEDLFAVRRYTCLVVRRPGCTPRVAIETLAFDTAIPDEIECATFGQQIVCAGRPVDVDGLIAMAAAGQFYDLRHLFLFPRISTGPERWIDPGLDTFWYNGSLRADRVAEALRGKPLSVDVRAWPEADVRAALAAKGYTEYDVSTGRLTLVLRPGIYPHQIIGIRPDGALIAVLVEGLSNRVGLTIMAAARLMTELGVRDALLIDNGADVMLRYQDETLIPGRERLRSVLLFHTRDAAHGTRLLRLSV